MEYSIVENRLYNDLDCPYDEESNKIDVYTSVYWSAENEEDYKKKENIIDSFVYEDNLVKANAWCDISGYNYWVIQQQEDNYISIDVYLKKNPDDYTQEEIRKISDLITEWNESFLDAFNEVDKESIF